MGILSGLTKSTEHPNRSRDFRAAFDSRPDGFVKSFGLRVLSVLLAAFVASCIYFRGLNNYQCRSPIFICENTNTCTCTCTYAYTYTQISKTSPEM